MERPIKFILVSVWYHGVYHWQMVAARKVGKHYQIGQQALHEIQRRTDCGNSCINIH